MVSNDGPVAPPSFIPYSRSAATCNSLIPTFILRTARVQTSLIRSAAARIWLSSPAVFHRAQPLDLAAAPNPPHPLPRRGRQRLLLRHGHQTRGIRHAHRAPPPLQRLAHRAHQASRDDLDRRARHLLATLERVAAIGKQRGPVTLHQQHPRAAGKPAEIVDVGKMRDQNGVRAARPQIKTGADSVGSG